MNKHIVISILLSCLVLTGCVSKAEFDALEERVSKLENSSSYSEPEDENQSAEGSPNQQDEELTEQSEDIVLTTESDSEFQTYSLDGMTANEIISLLDSFRYVYDGEPLSEYSEIFSVFPEEIYENGTYLFHLEGNNIDTNCIYIVHVSNVQMNDTILIDPNGINCVQIEMRVDNYDTASQIYDWVYNSALEQGYPDYMIENGYSNNDSDNREGTYWNSYVCGCNLEMEKTDSYYDLNVEIPLIVQ